MRTKTEVNLRAEISLLTGRTGKVRTQQPDPDTESAVAWNKIRAVYGPFNADVTLDKFRSQRSVTRMLGKTKHIAVRSVTCFILCFLMSGMSCINCSKITIFWRFVSHKNIF